MTGSRAYSTRDTPRIGGTLGGGSGPVRWGGGSGEGLDSDSRVSILTFIQRTPCDTSGSARGEVLQRASSKLPRERHRGRLDADRQPLFVGRILGRREEDDRAADEADAADHEGNRRRVARG